ncbi:MAG: DUF1549 domain-containing protein, partial [Verrucomicrobiota bacterium]|nr:DUF1549 domain-containing protein [Verrucomicrobiota bacterium]
MAEQSAGRAGDSSPNSAGMDFWSFQPIKHPSLPSVQNQSWVQSPVDNFILAKLESVGLAPAVPASKRELLRRLTVNLTGLLPSLEELRAFEADASMHAWSTVIDRLLASPR